MDGGTPINVHDSIEVFRSLTTVNGEVNEDLLNGLLTVHYEELIAFQNSLKTYPEPIYSLSCSLHNDTIEFYIN